jgi:hypothetical protein
MTATEFQCADPFRRMVVTWDGRHTMPCCQGFTLEIDGGPVVTGAAAPLRSLRQAWESANFDRLRVAHRNRTWDRAGQAGERSVGRARLPADAFVRFARLTAAARPSRTR